jgi:arabinofuranan 3-O-arabinosyltransferase
VLEVAENFNAGWSARAGDEVLAPVRVDGWKQAWVVPAGVAGPVELDFTPDRPYRAGLLLGLVGLLAVLAVALRPPRSRAAPAAVSRGLPRLTAALVVLGVLLTFGLGGAAVLGAAALLLGFTRKAPLALLAFLGVAAAAGVAAVVGVRPDPPAAVLQGCLLVLAWAAVLVAGLPARRPGGSSAGPDAR